ncbi:MAG: hypothetical protein WBA10_16260 [Elainellaceae cyanobacterium]
MIRSQRNIHVHMMTGLAGVLPIIFLAGLIYRPTIPTAADTADGLSAAANAPTAGQANIVVQSTVAVNGHESSPASCGAREAIRTRCSSTVVVKLRRSLPCPCRSL